jgi:hypothetical protein
MVVIQGVGARRTSDLFLERSQMLNPASPWSPVRARPALLVGGEVSLKCILSTTSGSRTDRMNTKRSGHPASIYLSTVSLYWGNEYDTRYIEN